MDEKIRLIVEHHNKLIAFLDSKSYSFYRFLSQRRLVASIYRSNYFELLNSFSFHNSQPFNDRFWDNKNYNRYRQKIQSTLVRNISNYLSSLASFIDFTRVNLIPYLKTNMAIYQQFEILKKEYLKNSKSHRFVQDLRNFTTHNSALSISSQISRTRNPDKTTVNIFIKKGDILKWSGWTPESLNFINAQIEQIYLVDILQAHYKDFFQFQDAIYLLLFTVNPAEVSAFQSEVIEAYNQIKGLSDKMHPLTKGYIKYLKKIIEKANRTTSA